LSYFSSLVRYHTVSLLLTIPLAFTFSRMLSSSVLNNFAVFNFFFRNIEVYLSGEFISYNLLIFHIKPLTHFSLIIYFISCIISSAIYISSIFLSFYFPTHFVLFNVFNLV
jgi:hypothetical protein